MKKILITGISGFLGSHTAIAALNKGYEVVGTIRDIKKAEKIKKLIAKHTNHIGKLSIAEANLLDYEIWNKLSKEVDAILHIASPFPRTLPKNEEDLVKPAKEGTLNVLQAASKNKLKKVVVTSSIGAIAYGKLNGKRKKVYDENDWTDESILNDSTPYYRSKTIAEKAAWRFIENDISGLEMVTICPGAILGPVLEEDFGTSANIVIKMMDGSTPAIPKIGFEIVDVRDVAELHLLALESSNSNGSRYVATSSFMELKQVAEVLRQEYPNRKIPKITIPNFIVRLVSVFIPELKQALIELGKSRELSSRKAREELDWNPRSAEAAALSCAKSAVDLELV